MLKQLNSEDPTITKNKTKNKISGLMRMLDVIFTPFSMNRFFLSHENYRDRETGERNIKLMKPIIYFAESGKLALYGGLLNYIINN